MDPNVEVMNPLMVLSLFERISMDDMPFLVMGVGGNPIDLILQKIPVPPVCIRPSVLSEIKAGT